MKKSKIRLRESHGSKLKLLVAFCCFCLTFNSVFAQSESLVSLKTQIGQGYLVLDKANNPVVMGWRVSIVERTFSQDGATFTNQVIETNDLPGGVNYIYIPSEYRGVGYPTHYLVNVEGFDAGGSIIAYEANIHLNNYNNINDDLVQANGGIPYFKTGCRKTCIGTTYAYSIQQFKRNTEDLSRFRVVPAFKTFDPSSQTANPYFWYSTQDIGPAADGVRKVQTVVDTAPTSPFKDPAGNMLWGPVFGYAKGLGDWAGQSEIETNGQHTIGTEFCGSTHTLTSAMALMNGSANFSQPGGLPDLPDLVCVGGGPSGSNLGGSGPGTSPNWFDNFKNYVTFCMDQYGNWVPCTPSSNGNSLTDVFNPNLVDFIIISDINNPSNPPISINVSDLYSASDEFTGFNVSLSPSLYSFGFMSEDEGYWSAIKEVEGTSDFGVSQAEMNAVACMSFDGTDDYLTSQTTALNNIGTGNFTFEATVNGIEADQGSHPSIFSNGEVSLFFHNIWGGSSTKMLCLRLGANNYFLLNNGTYDGSVLDGECHHVAVVRKATKLKFFIDGQLVGTKVISGNPSVTGGTLNIGQNSFNNYFFEGNISQLRIWNKTRGSSTLSANMNTPIPVQSGLKAYFELNDGNGQIADNKVDNFDAQLGSTANAEANDPSWGANCCVVPPPVACMSFVGTDDYLTSQTIALNNIGTGNFTFEATVNGIEADQGSHPSIFSNGEVSLFFHNIWGGSSTKMLCLRLGANNYFLLNNGTYDGSVLDGECHHVAVVRKATKLKFFIDGQLVGTKVISGNPSVTGGTLNIGQNSFNNYFFEGNISQLRIWNKTRGSSALSANMNTSIAVQSGLKAYFELNDGNGQIANNKVDNFDAQLGSTANADANDPTWTEECCDMQGARIQNNDTSNEETEQFSPNSMEQDITIYPNPNNGVFEVSFKGIEDEVTLEIYNSMGKLIESKEILNPQYLSVDLSQYSKGIYSIKVVTEERVISKRVIIQ